LVLGAKLNNFPNAVLKSDISDYISVIYAQVNYKGNDQFAQGSVYYNSTACPSEYTTALDGYLCPDLP
jgi:hypothetical protein